VKQGVKAKVKAIVFVVRATIILDKDFCHQSLTTTRNSRNGNL
jgi:hypothetical protein